MHETAYTKSTLTREITYLTPSCATKMKNSNGETARTFTSKLLKFDNSALIALPQKFLQVSHQLFHNPLKCLDA